MRTATHLVCGWLAWSLLACGTDPSTSAPDARAQESRDAADGRLLDSARLDGSGADARPVMDGSSLDGTRMDVGGAEASRTEAGGPLPDAGSGADRPSDLGLDARSDGAAHPSDAGSGAEAGGTVVSFHNGGFWNDSSGKRIEAHGGGLLRSGDTWYWFGEDKSHNSGGFKAVNCYASKDLSSWELRNAIITPATAPELAAADRIIERPKVIYNDRTKQYVMWLHWEGQSYATAEAGVFTSPTIDGKYTLRSHLRPNNNMSRDDTLFKDDDGKAYFISAANENADLMLYELTDDYLGIKRQVMRIWTTKREAPALFKHEGRYFLITSGCTGWDPNQAQYASATNLAGPWTALANLGNNTTFDTQPTFVIPVVGSQATTYIYASDRWQDPDLLGSKYIWLPLKVDGSSLSLDYYTDWQLDLATGVWSADDGYLPQTDWKLLYADSEETAGEDGRATNAFDGSPATLWHTRYEDSPYPHEIQIDLGGDSAVEGFRYLPRQDKDDHGMVARYQFYASRDRDDWGAALASGTFDSTRAEKRVTFSRKVARFIRFVALSEINGEAWTSMAELDLMGSRAP